MGEFTRLKGMVPQQIIVSEIDLTQPPLSSVNYGLGWLVDRTNRNGVS